VLCGEIVAGDLLRLLEAGRIARATDPVGGRIERAAGLGDLLGVTRVCDVVVERHEREVVVPLLVTRRKPVHQLPRRDVHRIGLATGRAVLDGGVRVKLPPHRLAAVGHDDRELRPRARLLHRGEVLHVSARLFAARCRLLPRDVIDPLAVATHRTPTSRQDKALFVFVVPTVN